MQELRQVHQTLNQRKQEKKELAAAIKQRLADTPAYKEITEQIEALKAKKKALETAIKGEYVVELKKIDDLAMEIKDMSQMVSDIAVTHLVRQESINIEDDAGTKYEPIIKVSFKRV